MDIDREEIAQKSLALHLTHQGKLAVQSKVPMQTRDCLLYTSDAADDPPGLDLGCPRNI